MAPRGVPHETLTDALTSSIDNNLANAFGRRVLLRLEPDIDWVFRITQVSETESPILPPETIAGTPLGRPRNRR